FGDIYRNSLKAYKEYDACLTTTIYGDTYLDPENCKAREHPRKKKKDQLIFEIDGKNNKEKGFRIQTR
ncbi:3953_t:CDS:2, partial [Acaulospora morrowiae]